MNEELIKTIEKLNSQLVELIKSNTELKQQILYLNGAVNNLADQVKNLSLK